MQGRDGLANIGHPSGAEALVCRGQSQVFTCSLPPQSCVMSRLSSIDLLVLCSQVDSFNALVWSSRSRSRRFLYANHSSTEQHSKQIKRQAGPRAMIRSSLPWQRSEYWCCTEQSNWTGVLCQEGPVLGDISGPL